MNKIHTQSFFVAAFVVEILQSCVEVMMDASSQGAREGLAMVRQLSVELLLQPFFHGPHESNEASEREMGCRSSIDGTYAIVNRRNGIWELYIA